MLPADNATIINRDQIRLNLPSDALEEFLSILRPALFSPSSPTFRASNRRHDSGSVVLSQSHVDLRQPFRSRDSTQMQIKSPFAASASTDEDSLRALAIVRASSPGIGTDAQSVAQTVPSLTPSASSGSFDQQAAATAPVPTTPSTMWRTPQFTMPRWLRSGAESPVSRTHTRNPFHRHPSYESAAIAPPPSLSLGAAEAIQGQDQLSPSLLPLPPSPSLSTAPVYLSPSAIPLETLDEEQEQVA